MRAGRVLRLGALLCAAIALPATAAVPGPTVPAHSAGGDVRLPAIAWSGQLWIPRLSLQQARPYANYWSPSPDTVYVDSAGRLHLSIHRSGKHWMASEIRSVRSNYGYGTYTFTVETPIGALDPNQILGLFVRNNLPSQDALQDTHLGWAGNGRYVDHAETDVEIGKWDWAHRGHPHRNTQYVVQPWWEKGRLKHLWLPTKTAYTVQFSWNADSTGFTVWRGTSASGQPVSHWVSPFSNGVPRPGAQVMLETWLIFSRPPARGQDQEVVIDSFSYQPSSG